jgi:hypothetical protein
VIENEVVPAATLRWGATLHAHARGQGDMAILDGNEEAAEALGRARQGQSPVRHVAAVVGDACAGTVPADLAELETNSRSAARVKCVSSATATK